MNKKYQVFVSSTYEDLIDERKEVTQALLESDCIPTGMELFPATSREQWEFIKSVIDECDYYLLISAGRYGQQGTDDEGKKVGYTEMEFDYALKKNKPIIAFLHNELDIIPNAKCEQTKVGKKRLEKFRKKAKTGRMVRFWNNKDNLKAAVLSSMPAMISDVPTIGWSRDINNENEKKPSPNDTYTGKWHSTTEHGVRDEIDLVYSEETLMLHGTIKREKPEEQKKRHWSVSGYVLGENIVLMYYSNKDNSVGCALVRHHHLLEYKGYYLRYNYGTKEIDKVELTMVKDENEKNSYCNTCI